MSQGRSNKSLEAAERAVPRLGEPAAYYQRRFLVRQAAFVSARIRILVSPFEYLLLAGGFDEINDDDEAVRCFGLARTAAVHPIDRGIAVRGFGRYLFSQGLLQDARRQHAEAVALFSGDSERVRTYRADTYVRWGSLDCEWGYEPESRVLFEKAAGEYEGLKNPTRRSDELTRVRQLLVIADNPDPGTTPRNELPPARLEQTTEPRR